MFYCIQIKLNYVYRLYLKTTPPKRILSTPLKLAKRIQRKCSYTFEKLDITSGKQNHLLCN